MRPLSSLRRRPSAGGGRRCCASSPISASGVDAAGVADHSAIRLALDVCHCRVGALFVLWLRKAMPESPRWAGRARPNRRSGDHCSAHRGWSRGPAIRTWTHQHRRAGAHSRTQHAAAAALSRQSSAGDCGVASYGFVVWVPTFLVQRGVTINGSLGQTVLMSLGGPTGALLGFLLSDRIGRRPLIIGASLLAAICGMAFATTTSAGTAVQ